MRTGLSIAVLLALLPVPTAGQDGPADVDVSALTRAADAGNVAAQRRLGDLYRASKVVPRDYAAALRYYSGAAQAGDAQAMADLGLLYAKGLGVSRDYAVAFKYFSQSAALGNIEGISDLGTMYFNGFAVPRDYALAFKYLSQGAAGGNPSAINLLGVIYHNGLGVPKDSAKALAYYSQAADKGNPAALNNLGRMYMNGVAVPKDVAKAIDLFRRAGDGGFAAGWFNLGLIYRDGLDGVPVDPAAANDAFKRAVAGGYTQAASFIVAPSAAARDFAPTAGAAPAAAAAPVRLTGAAVPAGPRLALVIANSNYAPNLNTLANPVNDGKLMAAALTKAGFVVTPRYDLTVVQMKDALATFVEALRHAGPNTTALFYYAGHGAAADGVNYLIPVGQAISSKTGLQTYGQSADEILRLLDDAKPVTTIVILDACRNVPFAGERGSDSEGLAQMDARNGSIIAYSTAPGHTAADGGGADSPYAAALAQMIRESNDPVEVVFRQVRKQVIEQTQNEQTPWESTSLVSDFSFVQH